jgi:hypothetical protein
MRAINTALSHHLDQVSIAKFVSKISADKENDDCGSKVPAMKQGRCLRRLFRSLIINPTPHLHQNLCTYSVGSRCAYSRISSALAILRNVDIESFA